MHSSADAREEGREKNTGSYWVGRKGVDETRENDIHQKSPVMNQMTDHPAISVV
jgi:hypothetical protein